ncbi:MAG: hypothetical protein HOB18_10455 [Nitrospina sp.]|nr:hypothetical protein [Nitrospina sp.]
MKYAETRTFAKSAQPLENIAEEREETAKIWSLGIRRGAQLFPQSRAEAGNSGGNRLGERQLPIE